MTLLKVVGILFFSLNSQAWEKHQTLMNQMVMSDAAHSRTYLKKTLVIPTEAEQKKTILQLVSDLQINGNKIPILKPGTMTIADFIQSTAIDEPDFGMDQDLPDSADVNNDRAWMGGKTGPTSQGFRHMIFPGMEWLRPLRSLQIPFSSVGQAPARILLMQQASKNFFDQKNIFWGLRTLLWELHLIQDLHQPFHTTQVPYVSMLPWNNIFNRFVSRSTQVIANFHYAYEGLIHDSVAEGKVSPLSVCFEPTPSLNFTISEKSISEVVSLSRSKAKPVGQDLYALWEKELKDPEVDLPQEKGSIDYYSYLHANHEEDDQQEKVDHVLSLLKTTCPLLKNLTDIAWAQLDANL